MPILVACPCGSRLRVDEQLAGRQMECPKCSASLRVEGPTVSSFDAFISYSAKDKPIADAICAALEGKDIRCWIAPRDILPGTEWSEAIIHGLDACRLLILVFSSNSNQSQQVVREVERAVHRGIPIVPFRIENLLPSKALEYFISCHHWLDAYQPPFEEHVQRLAVTSNVILDGTPASPAQTTKGDPFKAATRLLLSRDHRARVLVGLLVLLIVVAGLLYSLRPAVASRELIELKAQAEQSSAFVLDLDRDHGFGPALEELQLQVRTAATHFEQKRFPAAMENYRAASAKAMQLKSKEEKRQKALAARTQAEATRDAAEKDGAASLAAAAWKIARSKDVESQAALLIGDFDKAEGASRAALDLYRNAHNEAIGKGKIASVRKRWEADLQQPAYRGLDREVPEAWQKLQAISTEADAATKEGRFADAVAHYDRAKNELLLVGFPRILAYAYWTGYSAQLIWITVALSDSKSREEWELTYAQECIPFLDIDAKLMERIVTEKNNALRESLIYDSLGNAIESRYGKEAMHSYLLGARLAYAKVYFHQQTQSEIPRLQGVRGYEMTRLLRRMTRNAFLAGASQDIVDRLHKARGIWSKHLVFPRFATSSIYAANNISPEIKAITYGSMHGPLKAAQLFRSPKAQDHPLFLHAGKNAGNEVLRISDELSDLDPNDEIRKGSKCKVHETKLHAGKTYLVDAWGLSFSAHLRLEDSTKKTLMERRNGGEAFDPRLVFHCGKDDTYRIVVTTVKDDAKGFYYLRVLERPLDQDVKVLLSHGGQLVDGDPTDASRKGCYFHSFDAIMTANNTYLIDLTSPDFDTYLRLADSAGTKLKENDDGGERTNSRIEFLCRSDGTYRVVALGQNPGKKGRYQLDVVEHKPLGAVVLSKNDKLKREDPKDEVLQQSPCHVHEVMLKSGKTYLIDAVSREFDVLARLEDQQKKELDRDDDSLDGLNARIVFRPSADASYRIVVTTSEHVTGAYDLLVREIAP